LIHARVAEEGGGSQPICSGEEDDGIRRALPELVCSLLLGRLRLLWPRPPRRGAAPAPAPPPFHLPYGQLRRRASAVSPLLLRLSSPSLAPSTGRECDRVPQLETGVCEGGEKCCSHEAKANLPSNFALSCWSQPKHHYRTHVGIKTSQL
jgi:hypothetical protein